MKTTRTAPSPCWHCGKVQDATTGIGHKHKPRPGSVSICINCGQPAIFTADLAPREPTEDEWLELGANKKLQHILKRTQEFIAGRKQADG